MGGIVVAPYGKAFEHIFPIFDRTGADLHNAPAFQAGDSQFSKETQPGGVSTWSALANTALPVAHASIANIYRVSFTAADLACRRLIHRLQDITAVKIWNDDEWEIQTKDHHLAMHKDPLLVHAGVVQAIGAQSLTLENTPYPPDVPPGAMVHVTHSGPNTPRIRLAAAAGYNAATGLLPLDKVWGTLPILPGEYRIYAAPEVPSVVPADIQTVLGDAAAAIGMKWSGKSVVPTSIVAGVNTQFQFTTALTKTYADFFVPRAFVFHGGALDLYFGFVDDYAPIAGPKGLITPKAPLPAEPAVGDTVILM
jgi:hypothetical protein